MCITCLTGAQAAVQAAMLAGAPVAYGLWRRVAPRVGVTVRTYEDEHGPCPPPAAVSRDGAPGTPRAAAAPRS